MSSLPGLPRIVLFPALAAAAFVVAAWSPPHPKPTAEVLRPAEPLACSPVRLHPPGDFLEAIDVDGLTRQYLLHIPPAYRGADPVPLVLNLHGLAQSAQQQASYTGLFRTADREGFITVAPQAMAAAGSPARWNLRLAATPMPAAAPDDVAFIRVLLDRLEAQLCIDPERVYATGFSYGGMFAVRLACDLGSRIAAIAPVAGVYYPPWSPARPTDPPCAGPPVPIVAIHDAADPIVPYQGGAAPQLGEGITVRHVEREVLPAWAAHNGCAPQSVGAPVSEHVRLVRYLGCEAETLLYIIEGGTHAWPGADDAPPADLGRELSANQVIWSFFRTVRSAP